MAQACISVNTTKIHTTSLLLTNVDKNIMTLCRVAFIQSIKLSTTDPCLQNIKANWKKNSTQCIWTFHIHIHTLPSLVTPLNRREFMLWGAIFTFRLWNGSRVFGGSTIGCPLSLLNQRLLHNIWYGPYVTGLITRMLSENVPHFFFIYKKKSVFTAYNQKKILKQRWLRCKDYETRVHFEPIAWNDWAGN
jgi:hypothetical protein